MGWVVWLETWATAALQRPMWAMATSLNLGREVIGRFLRGAVI